MKKVSDLVFEYLKEQGVTTVFTLTGGGIMHLVDSMGRSGMEYVCCHHEQACSIAAQAYGMYQEQMNVCLVTTGPGGTNALTGAAAAWVDSTPMLFLTGQVKREDFAALRGVRQFGAQENDIISMAKPVTKYAEVVMEPEEILYHLQKAFYLAQHGRKGPVWLDIPLDVQAAEVEEVNLKQFRVEEPELWEGKAALLRKEDVRRAAEKAVHALKEAKRPLLLIGYGVMASKAAAEVYMLAQKLEIPVLATWRALSVFDSEDPLFFGSPGLQAPRYSNLILQGCDLLIVIGSRLDNMITAFNEPHFAFRAKKIIIDIDEKETDKLHMPEVTKVTADAGQFIRIMMDYVTGSQGIAELKGRDAVWHEKWLQDCRWLKERFPLCREKQVQTEGVDLYRVSDAISKHCRENDTIVISSTSRCNTAGHIAFEHKKGQRTISSMGMGSMGFAIPSAVGAWFASGKNRVIVLEGDGSLQLNIQELQTICTYGIEAKMFIFNNTGYAAITTMQERNFDGFYVGSNPESGVSMPDLGKIAQAYDIPYFCITANEETTQTVAQVMAFEGPVICDIRGSLKFDEIPKCISSVNAEGKRISAYLENPYPFLPEEEMQEIYERLLDSDGQE